MKCILERSQLESGVVDPLPLSIGLVKGLWPSIDSNHGKKFISYEFILMLWVVFKGGYLPNSCLKL